MAFQTGAFEQRKANILQSLSRPDDAYEDASPKGSIDAPIRDFIDEINKYSGLVTTSSCSGRISVFVDGSGKTTKGHGGKWLFVSHIPLTSPTQSKNEYRSDSHCISAQDGWHELFGMIRPQTMARSPSEGSQDTNQRYIHLKFEPLILHILTSGPLEASKLLSCAQQAGFRESGASNVPLSSPTNNDRTINVAIRTTGLAFDNIIGICDEQGIAGEELHQSLVFEDHLTMLVSIANQKFRTNAERIGRLQSLLQERFGEKSPGHDGTRHGWEDASARRERKRAEGLQRQRELRSDGTEI